MIIIKNYNQLGKMRKAGKLAAAALQIGGKAVKPGVTTLQVDRMISDYIFKQGGRPSFLGYNNYPAASCISINNEVIHGIPRDRKILEGDIVSIDVGVCFDGFHGDTSATFTAGDVSSDGLRLIDATRESLYEGIKAALPSGRIGDISSAIQRYVEARGYSVVREYFGHGVGSSLHEEPSVPNFGTAGRGVRLIEGMTIAVEPMVNMGSPKVKLLSDGWTVVTADGSLSAHFEHTIAITANGAEILTDL